MERTTKAVKQSHWWVNDTWVTFAIDKYVRIFRMRVNIKLFTSGSYVKVFAFHRMICINLNSTNQTNANRGVVTINPECDNWWFLTHSYAPITMFEKVPPKRQYYFHARLYRRRRTLETESTSRKFRTQIPQNYTLTQTTNRFRTAKQKKIHFRKKKQRWTHKKRYSPHLLYIKAKTHFLNYKRSIQKTDRSLR